MSGSGRMKPGVGRQGNPASEASEDNICWHNTWWLAAQIVHDIMMTSLRHSSLALPLLSAFKISLNP